MKIRVSATIDPETEKMLDTIMKDGNFRNKSHIIEDAIKFFKEEKYDKNKK
jgi:Arc/MetJ-type ribon-helix-helix transcriptional regulator